MIVELTGGAQQGVALADTVADAAGVCYRRVLRRQRRGGNAPGPVWLLQGDGEATLRRRRFQSGEEGTTMEIA